MKTKTSTAVVEGPRGLHMIEATARAIEARMKTAPSGDDFAYRRVAKSSSAFNCDAGSRTDVSTITTEAVDRDNEVVLAMGIDLTDYNGAVMFAHDYKQPPVGRNLWIKGKGNGLVAKTMYAAKPKDWGSDGWLPDALLSLMQGDPPTCTGKSIGFIPLGYRSATAQELDTRPELKGIGIIDKCSLMEYSVCGIPANPDSEMLMVSKGVPMDIRDIFRSAAKDVTGSEEIPAIIQPILKSFVSDATVKSYAERKAMEQLIGLSDQVAAKMMDRIYELLGRA